MNEWMNVDERFSLLKNAGKLKLKFMLIYLPVSDHLCSICEWRYCMTSMTTIIILP